MTHDHAPHEFAPAECLRCGHHLMEHAFNVERLAQAIHETMGGDPNFGQDGDCECRESADLLLRAYNDPTLVVRYSAMAAIQKTIIEERGWHEMPFGTGSAYAGTAISRHKIGTINGCVCRGWVSHA